MLAVSFLEFLFQSGVFTAGFSRFRIGATSGSGTQRLSMDHRPSDPAEARRVREEGAG